jgi:hypothetical protein
VRPQLSGRNKNLNGHVSLASVDIGKWKCSLVEGIKILIVVLVSYASIDEVKVWFLAI